MRYAQVTDGIVTNLLWLLYSNAQDFPGAVACNDVPVMIGDTYDGSHFYREGQRVLTPLEEAENTIAELDEALLALQYESLIGGFDK